MSLADLLPAVQSLPHQDKVSLLQFLASAIAQDEGLPSTGAGDAFAVWTPYGAFDAAQTLHQALQSDASQP